MLRRSPRLLSRSSSTSEESKAAIQGSTSGTETPLRVSKRTRHRRRKMNKNDRPASVTEVLWFHQPWVTQSARSILSDMKVQLQLILEQNDGTYTTCRSPLADKMADFALHSLGGRVVRWSKPTCSQSKCQMLFGVCLWCRTQSPQTVIKGAPVLPGKCWPFQRDQGALVISLAYPIRITHVTLDHIPRYSSPTGDIDSAPKDFEVYGKKTESEEGTLLGTFTYDQNGVPTQTFRLPNPSDDVYQFVELRILSNWGKEGHTCLYRFRVHGKLPSK